MRPLAVGEAPRPELLLPVKPVPAADPSPGSSLTVSRRLIFQVVGTPVSPILVGKLTCPRRQALKATRANGPLALQGPGKGLSDLRLTLAPVSETWLLT